jgi:ATP-binding cassette, subfamily A (ABC1), member 3
LTPKEHLELFGRIKGLEGESLYKNVDSFIEKMDLSDFFGTLATNLSGGNKRKLCVATSLIGGGKL